jgi:hypothetical protein
VRLVNNPFRDDGRLASLPISVPISCKATELSRTVQARPEHLLVFRLEKSRDDAKHWATAVKDDDSVARSSVVPAAVEKKINFIRYRADRTVAEHHIEARHM